MNAVDIVADLVAQHCTVKDDGNTFVDSFAISPNARAMRFLADHGRIEIIAVVGRRVIGKWIETDSRESPPEPAANDATTIPLAGWRELAAVLREFARRADAGDSARVAYNECMRIVAEANPALSGHVVDSST